MNRKHLLVLLGWELLAIGLTTIVWHNGTGDLGFTWKQSAVIAFYLIFAINIGVIYRPSILTYSKGLSDICHALDQNDAVTFLRLNRRIRRLELSRENESKPPATRMPQDTSLRELLTIARR